MSNNQFLQRVDALARERGLDPALILDHIERALQQAAFKRFDAKGDFTITIDRETGEIRAFEDDQPVNLPDLGRIVANVAKQVFVQGLKETERDMVFEDFKPREHSIASGTILREERGLFVVGLGRCEAILPREEQIPGETYRIGAVIRAYVLRVEKKGARVRIVLSRTHANFVRELFKAEIPEVADGVIEVKGIVREPGRRTKIAVASSDQRVDPVGACVGMRGSRICKVTDELVGEKIDIIPWAEDPAQFIENSLKPARVLRISYDHFRDRARVVVSQDQLPLAIGKAGQNVRLSARLTRFKIDVMSEEEAAEGRAAAITELQPLVDAGLLDDFQREQFVDNHLDGLAAIAAQEPVNILAVLDEARLDPERLAELVAKADSLLTPEQRSDKDAIVARRLDAERQAAEEQAREIAALEAEAAQAAQAAGVDLPTDTGAAR